MSVGDTIGILMGFGSDPRSAQTLYVAGFERADEPFAAIEFLKDDECNVWLTEDALKHFPPGITKLRKKGLQQTGAKAPEGNPGVNSNIYSFFGNPTALCKIEKPDSKMLWQGLQRLLKNG